MHPRRRISLPLDSSGASPFITCPERVIPIYYAPFITRPENYKPKYLKFKHIEALHIAISVAPTVPATALRRNLSLVSQDVRIDPKFIRSIQHQVRKSRCALTVAQLEGYTIGSSFGALSDFVNAKIICSVSFIVVYFAYGMVLAESHYISCSLLILFFKSSRHRCV